MSQDSNKSPSLSERAYVNAKRLRDYMYVLASILLLVALASAVILGASNRIEEEFAQNGRIESNRSPFGDSFIPDDVSRYPIEMLNELAYQHRSIVALNLSILALVTIILVSMYFGGRKDYRRIKSLIHAYLDESYILHFETSVPKGQTTAEKIFNQAKNVFPELRALKHKGKIDAIAAAENKTINSYTFDIALKTKEGYFIVKDFKDKPVTIEDLNQLVKYSRKISSAKVFRIISAARQYDVSLTQEGSLEKQMIENSLDDKRLDLLIDNGNSYSVIWIS